MKGVYTFQEVGEYRGYQRLGLYEGACRKYYVALIVTLIRLPEHYLRHFNFCRPLSHQFCE